MVLRVHVYPHSPTFGTHDLSNKVSARPSSYTSYKGVSVKDIGSILDNLHAGSSKSVRFAESTQVVDVDYSSVDTNDLWYTRAQLYLVQSETKKCLQGLDQQLHESEVDLGLERWVKRGAMKFQEHQRVSYNIVIGNKSSAHVLASEYTDIAIYTKMVANTRGMKLEREVRRYNSMDKDLVGMPTVASNRQSRRSRRSSRMDLSMYRRGSSRCTVALEEVNTALTTVRKLGLHNMPQSYLAE